MRLPIIVHVPLDTPASASVFVAGSLPSVGSWKADGVQLARAADSTYSGSLTLEAGQTLEYKFTCGSWDAVEKAADSGDRSNRELSVGATAAPITATVERWAAEPLKTNTVVGTLRIVQVPTSGPHGARTIRVRLPPSYDGGDRQTRFPVLYLQDGQNCFDRATSAYGSEWQVDETLTRLIADGAVPPLIVVGIDNAGADRTREYTFDVDPQDGGGGGAAYADLLLQAIMPFVEREFRVQTGSAHTFIGGSSLGALVSLETHGGIPGSLAACSSCRPRSGGTTRPPSKTWRRTPPAWLARACGSTSARARWCRWPRSGQWTRRTSWQSMKRVVWTSYCVTPALRKSSRSMLGWQIQRAECGMCGSWKRGDDEWSRTPGGVNADAFPARWNEEKPASSARLDIMIPMIWDNSLDILVDKKRLIIA